MSAVRARITYGVAALLLVVSLLGLRMATRDVFHYAVELGEGVPVVVYEPGEARFWGEPPRPGRRFPVVVLAHGFASNAGAMSTLARHLVRAGYAVITPDFRGHGRNGHPFAYAGVSVPPGLLEDLEAAVLYARTQPQFDGERVAVAGHSMGGSAVLAYAAHEPSVAAVIGISGGARPEGPYPPPNVLLIWASGDPKRSRTRFREVGAKLAGLERLVLDRTYGEATRGSAVRLSEVEGLDHLTILYSRETARRMVAWLGTTLGPGTGKLTPPASDGRFVWCGLGLAAAMVLLWGLVRALTPLLPREALAEIQRPLGSLAILVTALLATLLLFAGVDSMAAQGPFGFVPLTAGRDLIGFFALSGALLWVWLAVHGRMPAAGLRDVRTYIGAGLLVGCSYVLLGSVLQPAWDLWLATHRLPWCLLCTALCLPYFGASEWLLRGPTRTGVWLPVLGKLLTLGALVVGAAVGLLPVILLFGIAAIAPAFLILEVFAYRLSRVAPAPWVPALFQAAWLGWIVGSVFPLEV